jgi:hypothetical protein
MYRVNARLVTSRYSVWQPAGAVELSDLFEDASSSRSDIDHYVIIRNLLESTFNIGYLSEYRMLEISKFPFAALLAPEACEPGYTV